MNAIANDLIVKAELLNSISAAQLPTPGENFNVLTILRNAHDEEHLHSAFLAHLLDPNATHGFGARFLRIFLKEHFQEALSDLDQVHVAVEKTISAREDDASGRIDILISATSWAIAIENKIYAGDQPEQLHRYAAFLKRAPEQKTRLLYLTLDGSQAAEYSVGDATYETISYSGEIHVWLRQCREIAANAPTVREAISQYIMLIDDLTGQRLDPNAQIMIDEISNSSKKLHAALSIAQAANEAKGVVLQRLWTELRQAIEEKAKAPLEVLHFKETQQCQTPAIHNQANPYVGRWTRYVGIALVDTSAVGEAIPVARVELDDCIYVGVTAVIRSEDEWRQIEVPKASPLFAAVMSKFSDINIPNFSVQAREDDWWPLWGFPGERRNFRNFDMDVAAFADRNARQNYVNEICNIVFEIHRLLQG